jgi:glycosyltransferase involved in cell wall biosynthesis
LHLGGLHGAPSFTSLQFLLGKVFPLLDPDTISRLKLEVLGKFEAGEPRAKTIIEMARPYPMVSFCGFVEDIRAAYRRNDLQVVASTQATGRRTRIIESWALGMPVLSTQVGVGGVTHLAPGQNILIANDPSDFARILKELAHNHERLDEIAKAARATYELAFGRRTVANTLWELLRTSFGVELRPSAV